MIPEWARARGWASDSVGVLERAWALDSATVSGLEKASGLGSVKVWELASDLAKVLGSGSAWP
jgi:hypothetical protein